MESPQSPKLTTVVPPQNFAVASAMTGTRRQVLKKRVVESWLDWLLLFNDPDVWTNPEKRRAMIQARFAYHDAFVQWMEEDLR